MKHQYMEILICCLSYYLRLKFVFFISFYLLNKSLIFYYIFYLIILLNICKVLAK